MVIKPLTTMGNSKGIIIDKGLLQSANLSDDALFGITVNPNGGITIQSVEATNPDIKAKVFKKVIERNRELLKRLADQ